MAVIDASLFVALLKEGGPGHEAVWKWMSEAIANGQKMYAPAILLPEVGAAISRGVGDPAVAKRSIDFIKKSKIIELVPISVGLAVQAAQVAAEQRVRGCDSVYLAVAIQTGEPLATLDNQQIERGGEVVSIVKII